ncbi:hypothetical protein M0802_007643 [Mischocyttarus mexicanus]|nr:hypothetical protein M0802_007643 [Mischocyttarus mexicanus]
MMLLNLTSFNTTLRTFPYWRLSSFLSTSVLNQETNNIIKTNESLNQNDDKYTKKNETLDERKIKNTNLSQTSMKELKNTIKSSISLNERIIRTKNSKDLIDIMNDPKITIDQVKKILNQISNLKPNVPTKQGSIVSDKNKEYEKVKSSNYSGFLPLATPKLIEILKTLSYNNDRNVPLLKTLTCNIAVYSKQLNIRMCGDILYSLAVLNYLEEMLLEKIMTCLLDELHNNKNSTAISSIAMSLKILKYKNCKVLDAIYEWVNNNLASLRFKDFNSIIGCLAVLGHIPENMDILQDYINSLNPEVTTDKELWLDFVWSLTLLNRASQTHISSVLNHTFVENILLKSKAKVKINTLKLLNINGAARTIMKDYNGPYIENMKNMFSVVSESKVQKLELIDTLCETLKEITPSFQKNVNTKMGFNIDVACCLNSQNKLVEYDVDSNNTRLAMMVYSFHDYCRGQEDLLGIGKFYNSLLTEQGFKVLDISYQNLSVNDIIAKNVKYLQHEIELLKNSLM